MYNFLFLINIILVVTPRSSAALVPGPAEPATGPESSPATGFRTVLHRRALFAVPAEKPVKVVRGPRNN